MTEQKKRYKAVIANQSYTIIGRESKQHMDMVTKLVNDQLTEIMGLSSQVDKEQAAILLAINAISDQLKKQEQVLSLQNKVEELRSQAIKATELENRIKRIEAIESEARQVLDETGRGDVEIHNHVEAQQILNEQRKRKIQEKSSSWLSRRGKDSEMIGFLVLVLLLAAFYGGARRGTSLQLVSVLGYLFSF